MATNVTVTLQAFGPVGPEAPQPMVISPLYVSLGTVIGKWGGPFDETSQYGDAGYDMAKYYGRYPLPDRSEFQRPVSESFDQLYAIVADFINGRPFNDPLKPRPPVKANMRPAWLADP